MGPKLCAVPISGYYNNVHTSQNGYSIAGYVNNAGILNTSLTATQAAALYNVPATFQYTGLDTAATAHYGLQDMLAFFSTFNDGPGSTCSVGDGRMWTYTTNLPATEAAASPGRREPKATATA